MSPLMDYKSIDNLDFFCRNKRGIRAFCPGLFEISKVTKTLEQITRSFICPTVCAGCHGDGEADDTERSFIHEHVPC